MARAGRGGVPAARDRHVLQVQIGNEFPDYRGTPPKRIKATIIFEGSVPDGNEGPYDFALLHSQIDEEYNKENFEKFQDVAVNHLEKEGVDT